MCAPEQYWTSETTELRCRHSTGPILLRHGGSLLLRCETRIVVFVEIEMCRFQFSEIRDLYTLIRMAQAGLSSRSCGQRIGALAENGEIGVVAENAPSLSARDLFENPEAFEVGKYRIDRRCR